jgi:hypothetical protein
MLKKKSKTERSQIMAAYGCNVISTSSNKTVKEKLSSIKYAKPSQSLFRRPDMAICFVFFNPAQSSRMLMNYLYTIEKMKNARIPWFTLELCYGDNLPEIKKAVHIRTRSENVMFHKEQLCHLLEQQIPWTFTKLMFLDADIVFESVTFYDEVSKLLEVNDIVQPFKFAKWVDASYSIILQERLSCALMNRKTPYDSVHFHPGFGWAFRRKWFQKVGFFKYGITGSGDTLSVAAWLQMPAPKVCLVKAIAPAFKDFFELVKKFPPRVSCANDSVFHLWHGTHKKRQYVSRHLILRDIEDVRDILETSSTGLFDFNYGRDHDSTHTVTKVSEELQAYFLQRDDDEV